MNWNLLCIGVALALAALFIGYDEAWKAAISGVFAGYFIREWWMPAPPSAE